jgi:hypothetical protein
MELPYITISIFLIFSILSIAVLNDIIAGIEHKQLAQAEKSALDARWNARNLPSPEPLHGFVPGSVQNCTAVDNVIYCQLVD